jgi:hypothetical protein
MSGFTVDGRASPWRLSSDDRLTTIGVTVPKDVTAVKLSLSTLADTTSEWNLPLEALHLCSSKADAAIACPADGIRVVEGRIPLYLKVDSSFTREGVFTGNLEFTAMPSGEVKTLQLTVHQSSTQAMVCGAVLIAIGVFAAWLLISFGRGRLARDQAILMAELLRQRVHDLGDIVARVPINILSGLAATTLAVKQISDSLSTQGLDAAQYIPPRIPAFGAAPPNVNQYPAFLQAQSRRIDVLDVVVHEGVLRLTRELAANPGAGANVEALQILLSGIDVLCINPDVVTARAQIGSLFSTWYGAIGRVQAQAAASSAPDRETTAFSLIVEMRNIAIVSWITWGVLTVVAGFAVLILPNPGFGETLDYVRCLFWGFGVPVAGQSLQQLTPSALNTQLGITMPRQT